MTTEVKHLMVDIETLGTNLTSVVTSIAVVPFTMQGGAVPKCDSLIRAMHVGEQLVVGRTVDASTLRWWAKQDENARAQAFLGVHLFSTLLADLRACLSQCEYSYFWCKGPSFDAAMLDSLFESFGEKSPFQYKKWRDVRTMCDGVETPEFEGMEHDPYDDCVNQINHVCRAWVIRNSQPSEYGEKS